MDAFSIRLDATDVPIRVDVESGPGGAGRDRTDDLRLAKPALSQLSYSPNARSTRTVQENLEVRPIRFDQSPYVESASFLLCRLQAAESWWAWVDSNHRPPAYQADALTT